MQNEIMKQSDVLNEDGFVGNCGWSRQPVFYFDKSLCKNRLSLYERDTYLISNERVSVYLSIADLGITAEVCAIVADHETGVLDSRTVKKFVSFGSLGMPASSKNGDVTFTDSRVGMNFSNTALKRYIRCDFVDFSMDKNLYINVTLEDNIEESLNTLIPAKRNKKNFYLKRFMPAMKASGIVRCGGEEYNFTPENSCAYLDWQRCFFNDKSCYHALYCDTVLDGHQFSLSLAGGIGVPFRGSENCYFYDGIIHKFAAVKAIGSEDRPDKPWKFSAGNSCLELTFKPDIKAGHLMSAKCGQKTVIFGKLYGNIARIDSGEITLDAVPAHIEFTMI